MKRLEENVECKDRTAHAPAIVYHSEDVMGEVKLGNEEAG